MKTARRAIMLPLDSARWAELNHAYGKAANVPQLLRQLESFPTSEDESEPWFSIWSALAHQGDVYSASFAAVPHVVRVLALDPVRAGLLSYYSLPGSRYAATNSPWRFPLISSPLT